MSFWAIALSPNSFSGLRLRGLYAGGDTPRLLSQNIAKSMREKKEVEPRAVRRPRLQIIQRCLERQVADDAGQSPRQICRLLVQKQSGGDSGGAPQLHQRYTVEIRIKFIEGAEYRK